MPSVDLSLIGKKSEPVVFEYTWKDVALYALGVGASSEELPFVYEGAPGGIKVLPSFCVVPAYKAFPDLGSDIEWSLMLHGEQSIRLSRPVPPEGKLVQVGEVAAIYDKGKGAVFHLKVTGRTEDGKHLYDASWAIFYLGAGGFGGDPGPREKPLDPPDGVEPDVTISSVVGENQAILYRLSGDLNPLHLDPEASKRGGFDRPILHGLCTYGYAVRSAINGVLGGDVTRFKNFKARFSRSVYPGDTLTTRCWVEEDRCLVNVSTEQGVVLKNGVCEFGEPHRKQD
jgi:acyl dehydratase